MLTLAIGDFYIPERAIEISDKFQKLLAPNPNSTPSNSKISQVLCLGNITSSLETLDFLHNLTPSLHLVRGEFDDVNILSQRLAQLNDKQEVSDIPNYKIIIHDNLKIGFTNGYLVVPKSDPLSLLALARELDVDVLIWGGTHKVEAYILDGKFFINPGSATGASSFDWPNDEESEDEEQDEQETKDENEDEIPEKTDEDASAGNEDKSDEKDEDEAKESAEAESETKQEPESKEESTKEEPENTEESEQSPKESDTSAKEDAVEKSNEPEPKESEDFSLADIQEALESFANVASFCLLETYDSTCTLYIYTYFEGEVKVDKVTYHKE